MCHKGLSVRYVGLCLAVLLSACTGNELKPTATVIAPPIAPPRVLKIALVLGGGAAKGFAHIGVIKILEAQGISPQIVVGTSAGSVVGAVYASGYSGVALQEVAMDLDESTVGDLTLPNRGFIKGEGLQNYINKLVRNQPIEKFKRRFGAVATNLKTGESVLFQQGNAGLAVRASSSIPGVFQPTLIGGYEYVDGGVISPVPVRFAKQMGADFIIAVDISSNPSQSALTSTKAVMLQSVNIMGKALRDQELQLADVLIRPQVGTIGPSDFESRNKAVLEGEKAALAMLPQLKQKLEARRKQFSH